ncbi:MAG: hypothetical protein HeimC2_42070 [Candidatus Heimdallarchaeota archaeon LC_2]|nr:MAG: hypothetical protein HeimC2_42070 [Candidatus Heimdallarchaeota archaeon LC_2]
MLNKFINKILIDYKRMKLSVSMPSSKKYRFLSSLYVVLFFEIVYFLSSGNVILSLILLGLGAILIIFRLLIFPHRNSYWFNLKQQLSDILLNKKILLSDNSNDSTDLTFIRQQNFPLLINPELIDNTPINFENKQGIIQELRSIGLDGILICLFLVKNNKVFCSAKNIFRAVNLPQTSGYRHMQKLLNLNYIYTKSTFDNPHRNYFQLTVDGNFLIYDLYKIIKF